MTIATRNVQVLGRNEVELDNILKEYEVNTAVITETKKKLKCSKDLLDYIIIYSGVPKIKRASCGVAVFRDKKLAHVKTEISPRRYSLLDRKRNDEIRRNLNIVALVKKIGENRKKVVPTVDYE